VSRDKPVGIGHMMMIGNRDQQFIEHKEGLGLVPDIPRL
jgi:hypothetical protein